MVVSISGILIIGGLFIGGVSIRFGRLFDVMVFCCILFIIWVGVECCVVSVYLVVNISG